MMRKQVRVKRVQNTQDIDCELKPLLTKIIFEQNHIHTVNWRAIRKLCIQANPTPETGPKGIIIRLRHHGAAETGIGVTGQEYAVCASHRRIARFQG